MRRKILLNLSSEIRRLKNCSKRLNNDWYQHAKCSGIPFLNRHCLQRFQFRGLCEQIGVIIRKMCWRVFRKHQTARTCTTELSLRYTFFIFSSQVLFCRHVLWRNCSCTKLEKSKQTVNLLGKQRSIWPLWNGERVVILSKVDPLPYP